MPISQFRRKSIVSLFFFLNDTATPEISPLPLPAPLPIFGNDNPVGPALDRQPRIFGGEDALQQNRHVGVSSDGLVEFPVQEILRGHPSLHQRADSVEGQDRKSTRLNSSHLVNSYAVFCLK